MLSRLRQAIADTLSVKRETSPAKFHRATVRPHEATTGRYRNQPVLAGVSTFLSVNAIAVMRVADGVTSNPPRLFVPKASNRGQRGGARRFKARDVAPWELKTLKRSYYVGAANPGVWTKAAQIANSADEIEEITDHPFFDVYNDPNVDEIGPQFWWLVQANSSLAGNAFVHKVIGSKRIELFNLMPHHVHPQPREGTDGQLIEGWWYGRERAAEEFFPADEVMHLKYMPNPLDPYLGMSPVRCMMDEHELIVRATQQMVTVMDSGARPDFAISVDPDQLLNTEQFNRLRVELNDMQKGVGKSSFAIIPGGFEAKPLAFTPRDMEYQSLIEEATRRMLAAHGVPMSVYTMDAAIEHNAGQGMRGFAMWGLLPNCNSRDCMLTERLLPEWDGPDGLFAATPGVVPEDEQAQVTNGIAEVNAGVRTSNEYRAERGLDAVPDGDELRFNGVSVTALDRQATQPATVGGGIDPGPFQMRSEGTKDVIDGSGSTLRKGDDRVADGRDSGCDCCGGLCGTGDGRDGRGEGDELRGAGDQFQRAASSLQSELWLKALDDPSPFSDESLAAFLSAIKGTLNERLASILAAMDDKPFGLHTRSWTTKDDDANVRRVLQAWGIENTDDLVGSQLDKTREFVDRLVDAGIEDAKARIAEQLDDADDDEIAEATQLGTEDVERFFEENAERYRAILNAEASTQASRLAQTLSEGLASGDGLGELKKRVRAILGPDASNATATRIVRTEASEAQNFAREEMFKASPVVKGKRWLKAPNACEFCQKAANDFGDTTVALGEPFYKRGTVLVGVSGGRLSLDFKDVNSAPLHPHCRCGVVPVVER